MARAFDTAQYFLGRLGWAGALGAALLCASGAYWQFGVKPIEAQAVAQTEDNARAREAMRADAEQLARSGAGAAARPALAPAVAAALRRLFDAADRAGLQLDRGEYRLTEVGGGSMRRYQLSLPVAGSYPAIRAFLAQALNEDPALALIALRVRRESIETPELDAMLQFTLYLEAGA